MESEPRDLCGGQVFGEIGGDEARLDGPPPDRVDVDARTVVHHRELDGIVIAPRIDPYDTGFGLASRPSLGSRLDPMGDGVAYEMQEWIPQAVEDRAVELDRRSLHHERHAFAERDPEVPRQAR